MQILECLDEMRLPDDDVEIIGLSMRIAASSIRGSNWTRPPLRGHNLEAATADAGHAWPRTAEQVSARVYPSSGRRE